MVVVSFDEVARRSEGGTWERTGRRKKKVTKKITV